MPTESSVDVTIESFPTPSLPKHESKPNYSVIKECHQPPYGIRGVSREQPWNRAKQLPQACLSAHRWVLPVLCYPRNMVIYHYPLIGVMFMVILLIFIIRNCPNSFSNYYPKYTIRVIYPFIFNLGYF